MRLIIILVCLIPYTSLLADNDISDVYGYWLNESKEYIVEIYNDNNVIKGKVIWLSEAKDIYGQPLRDVMNDEPKYRSRLIMGLDVLDGFEFDEDVWKSGILYNFKTGNDYNIRMKIDNKGQLRLTGYYGILFFLGKTKVWTRVKDLKNYGIN